MYAQGLLTETQGLLTEEQKDISVIMYKEWDGG